MRGDLIPDPLQMKIHICRGERAEIDPRGIGGKMGILGLFLGKFCEKYGSKIGSREKKTKSLIPLSAGDRRTGTRYTKMQIPYRVR